MERACRTCERAHRMAHDNDEELPGYPGSPSNHIRRVCSTRPCNQRNQRSERLMAEMMAFSELVTIEVSMPTPHTMLVLSSSPIWHST